MNIKRKHILVVGDVMLDIYRSGTINRISPEASVPVLKELDVIYKLGGAANVAANLIAAQQNVSLATVVGKDKPGQNLLAELKKQMINSTCIINSNSRRTTTKTRYLGQNNQQVLRVDIEDTDVINDEESEALLNKINQNIQSYDLIVISDYCKGVLSNSVVDNIVREANRYNIKVIADVKDPELLKYRNMFLIKPNLQELHMLTNMPIESEEDIINASYSLLNKTNCNYVLTTCGEKGMYIINEKCEYKHFKGVAKEVFDVTGAGDTVISYLAVGIVNDLTLDNSLIMANIAAGIQVSKVGTSQVFLSEIEKYYEKDKRTKVIGNKDLALLKNTLINKKVVFTNGCFDILHAGHIYYLRKAAELGDILIIGLNSDASIRRLKGDTRPINKLNDRITILSELTCVDYIITFDEDTPYQLIKDLKPNVLVKGSDYKKEDIVGYDILQLYGGEVEVINYIDGQSTTNIIERIRGE